MSNFSSEIPNGPLSLTVGDKTFTASQRMVLVDRNVLSNVGVQSKEIVGFPIDNIEAAKKINILLNEKSHRAGSEPSINAFNFEFPKRNVDYLFIKVPVGSEKQAGSVLAMLVLPSGSGKEFLQKMQDDSMDEPVMKELLGNIMRTSSSQKIDTTKIIAKNLVVYPDSAVSMAINLITGRVKMPVVYDQIQKDIVVHNIPEEAEEIDLSKFVKQSIFFRDDPSRVPQSGPREEKETIPYSSPSRYEGKNDKTVIKMETEDEEEIQEIADSVSEPIVNGKFNKPVVMRGLNSPGRVSLSDDYSFYTNNGAEHPSSTSLKIDPTGYLWHFQNYCYDQQVQQPTWQGYRIPDGIDIKNSLIFSYVPKKDSDMVNLMVMLPSTIADYGSRAILFVDVYCIMPKEKLNSLFEVIEKNPVNAERFIQVAFQGIDNFAYRRPVQGVSIFDVAKYLSNPKLPANYDYGRMEPYYHWNKEDYDVSAVRSVKYPQSLPIYKSERNPH